MLALMLDFRSVHSPLLLMIRTVPALMALLTFCVTSQAGICEKVLRHKEATVGVAGVGAVAGGTAVGAGATAAAMGATAVAHSSGAYILTGGAGYIAGSLGTAGAVVAAAPFVLVGGVALAGAAGGTYYYCKSR